MRPDCKAFLPLGRNLSARCCKFQPRCDWVAEQELSLRITSLGSRSEGAPIFSTYNPLYSVAGFLVGMLVGMTGVGGGSLMTPILVLLFNFHPATAVGTDLLILYPRLPVARIAASDIAHAVPLTLIAGLGHWLMGSVDFALMLALLAGSIPGIVVGSLLSGRSSDAILRPVLATTLLIVAVRMLVG